jgi:hypothetical protein
MLNIKQDAENKAKKDEKLMFKKHSRKQQKKCWCN